MTDKQILAWLKVQCNGAHTQWVSLPRLIKELEALTMPGGLGACCKLAYKRGWVDSFEANKGKK